MGVSGPVRVMNSFCSSLSISHLRQMWFRLKLMRSDEAPGIDLDQMTADEGEERLSAKVRRA
jgi:hypothetical protein